MQSATAARPRLSRSAVFRIVIDDFSGCTLEGEYRRICRLRSAQRKDCRAACCSCCKSGKPRAGTLAWALATRSSCRPRCSRHTAPRPALSRSGQELPRESSRVEPWRCSRRHDVEGCGQRRAARGLYCSRSPSLRLSPARRSRSPAKYNTD